MSIRLWLFGFGVILPLVLAGLPTSRGKAAQPSLDSETDYAVLLARAKEDPKTVDFAKLRLAFATTAAYQPYQSYHAEDREIDTLMKSGDWLRALDLINALLDKNYIRIRSHLHAFIAYRKKGDAERASYHRAFVDGLFRSIVNSGDGRTPETAFVVINTEEEYDVIGLSGWQPGRQGLQHKGEKSFDVMTVKTSDSGETRTLYFDITIPWSKSPFGKMAPGKK